MPARPQLLALVGIRKGLERIFSPHDMSWLDGPLPGPGAAGKHPRERPEQGSGAEEVGAVLRPSLAHNRPGGTRGGRGASPETSAPPTVRADAAPGTADQPVRELGRGGAGAVRGHRPGPGVAGPRPPGGPKPPGHVAAQ